MLNPLGSSPVQPEGASPGLEPAKPAVDPQKVRQAAQDFEALLMGQLLKSTREAASGGWMGTGEEDQAGEQAVGLAEEFFARSLAAQGGLGLAKMVEQGLGKK